jgi:DeoR family transcriptional regulator, fructose operon transcriptional repressor
VGYRKPEERQEQILAQLRALQSEISVAELAQKFGVSELTIRRDLERLEADSAVFRTHGGCLLRSSVESAYHRRVSLNFELKQAIGRAAANEIKTGEVILINDGSTPFHLAANLGSFTNLLVYTTSLAVISVLSRFPGVRLYVLGGEFHPNLQFMGGPLTEQILEGLQFDRVFLGADAIDAKGNCLVSDPDVARLTEIMLRRGRRRVLLADGTKVGANGHAVYATLANFDAWYTTPGISPVQLRQFSQQTSVKMARL